MEQVLIFQLGEETFGLEVALIQEVVESPLLHYIPRAPNHVLGAINFHGNILPVLDLASYLGFPSGGRDHRVVVLPPEVCSLALAVASIRRIIPMDAEALLPFPREQQEQLYIRAVLNYQGTMINLLDTTRLLASLETV
ncbi:chemotaxis signal transduction protein [Desulfuromonas soudanensis]|uniref:Chemotaxis signal transduction protein n=1 Tax=Desulfuromonas soudanensis TaxID=1603606 RepID=A0A0M5ILT4_9BACT|nr:chemotaxis protein CheW [Desulfuromonas soudanensis]ALC18268.1 chemotaxis signal transduction protein [Desulfuromonas soudanensis]